MIVAVPSETFPGERRVALVPSLVPGLIQAGFSVQIQAGAGLAAGYPDAAFQDKGATIVASRSDLFAAADIVLQVRALGMNLEQGRADLSLFKPNQAVLAFCDPLINPAAAQEMAAAQVRLFSMELMPRITRAQSMDALSSMATISGYKAVLLAAETLPKMFPMMMTAAGTLTAARVFVIGAGVAGLQAIATARRLGAVVSAYDVRPAAREQVLSVGGKFVHMDLEAGQSEGAGGYAKAMDEEFYRRQRELMTRVVAEHDVVITTAAIPGKKSPILVTSEMVAGMPAGSVIIDLAAERGGNCESTRADETVRVGEVTILGPTNLPATVPYHASQMYSKNITTFLNHLVKKQQWQLDAADEIVRETLITRDGQVQHAKIRALLGLPVEQSVPVG